MVQRKMRGGGGGGAVGGGRRLGGGGGVFGEDRMRALTNKMRSGFSCYCVKCRHVQYGESSSSSI